MDMFDQNIKYKELNTITVSVEPNPNMIQHTGINRK